LPEKHYIAIAPKDSRVNKTWSEKEIVNSFAVRVREGKKSPKSHHKD
jgi:hypothetical protein